jgi:hypothetical protein
VMLLDGGRRPVGRWLVVVLIEGRRCRYAVAGSGG